MVFLLSSCPERNWENGLLGALLEKSLLASLTDKSESGVLAELFVEVSITVEKG